MKLISEGSKPRTVFRFITSYKYTQRNIIDMSPTKIQIIEWNKIQFSYIYFLKFIRCIQTWMQLLFPPLDATFSLFWLGSCYACMENLQSHLSLHVYKPLCSERGPFLLTNWPFFLWKLSHFLLKASPFMLEIVSTAAEISVTRVQCLSSQRNVKTWNFE